MVSVNIMIPILLILFVYIYFGFLLDYNIINPVSEREMHIW